jgi:Bifunctional DNA primase/polymerase, N-terminal
MSGIFSKWQREYAARGIATFPVAIEGKDKRPMNKGYQRTGLRRSAELAKKFAAASAFGMMLGHRNNISLVDVDTRDERALADALSTYGDTPIVPSSFPCPTALESFQRIKIMGGRFSKKSRSDEQQED